jgi:hypothetical protein
MDFYDKAKKRIYFFHDDYTLRNQREEISTHLTKMIGIVRAFSRAIVEYRKARFGDRKVGVAAGAMWLEAAKAQTNRVMSVADYYRMQRVQMGGQDVGE